MLASGVLLEGARMSDLGLFAPRLLNSSGEVPTLGEPLVDEYLRFTAARVRPNTLKAQIFDLKVFFTLVAKRPQQVGAQDVLGFIEQQRMPPSRRQRGPDRRR